MNYVLYHKIPYYIGTILCSWDHASQFYVNKCPTRCYYTQFILSVNCCTCFGWFLHPSSGAQIIVSTASGTSRPLLLLVAITEELRPPNHVEQFTDKRNYVELHLVGHLLTCIDTSFEVLSMYII